MEIIITIIPILLVIYIIAKEAWQTWKDGLFLALIKLGISLVSVVLAFLLTRLLVNPAWIDLFGLGKLLLSKVPKDFLIVNPPLKDFLKALPTALLALLAFTGIFDLLRVQGNKLLAKLDEKHQWSKKILKVKGEKLYTACTGVLTSVVCLLTDLVILCGTLTFSGNMLYCAKAATGEKIFSSTGDVVHQLEENPVIQLANAMGAEKVFFSLTTAQRDGKTFSVGQEMIQLSNAFVDMLPVFDVLPKEGQTPTPEQIRALPEALGDNPETMGLMVGLMRSYRQELGDSDAVLIISSLMGTTPERFEKYLSKLTVETAHDDLVTFCNIAALLGDRGQLPEEGGSFDLSTLSDPSLLEAVQQEMEKNPALAEFFAEAKTDG